MLRFAHKSKACGSARVCRRKVDCPQRNSLRTVLPGRSIRSFTGMMRLGRNKRYGGRSALPPRSACSAGSPTPSAILKLFQLVSPGARLRIVL